MKRSMILVLKELLEAYYQPTDFLELKWQQGTPLPYRPEVAAKWWPMAPDSAWNLRK